MVQSMNHYKIRCFLGLTGFFRRFEPHYAELANPLSELTKEGIQYTWRPEQQLAFQTLKDKFTDSPVLHLFNANAYTE